MEKCLGPVKFFLAYHLGTVITVFLWYLLFQKRSMAGASTGIFFVIGIYAALCRREDFRQGNPFCEGHRRYLIGYTLVSCLLGIGTIAAHGIGL